MSKTPEQIAAATPRPEALDCQMCGIRHPYAPHWPCAGAFDDARVVAAIEADRAQRAVWTLTVDDGKSIGTTVHPSEADALTALYEKYADPNWPRDDFIQGLIDTEGLVIYIEEHSA